jgi:aspartyl-tRNA(Asn)/glutamyl-tRNA(Gln) amidotransferase subunit B
MNYEAIIGLEVHAQLLTASKIFCSCSTRFGDEPNQNTCPVCMGMPGVLPVLNKKVVEFAIRAGLATHCEIARYSRWARKNYFYPDLPKGYQISQYELPLCRNGYVEIDMNGATKRVRLTRIHMEEDAGKNIHDVGAYSLVDLNRAGVPLLEIVSEPDMRSPEEAGLYLRSLRAILQYLEICDGNMEEGSFRCDANVSVRPEGSPVLGVKVEVKNMNSFKAVEKALGYEIERQSRTLIEGGRLFQETRLWDPDREATRAMRSKEEAHDYRYFPDPDLLPLVIDEPWMEEIRAGLPELPEARKKRFAEEFGIPGYDAAVLTAQKEVADYYERAVRTYSNPKALSNWIMGEVLRLIKDGEKIGSCKVSPENLARLVRMIDEEVISGKIAKMVFEEMAGSGRAPEEVVSEKGIRQITDLTEIEAFVFKVLSEHPKEVGEYRAGKEKLFGFFVGQVMKETGGTANPKIANEVLKKALSEVSAG